MAGLPTTTARSRDSAVTVSPRRRCSLASTGCPPVDHRGCLRRRRSLFRETRAGPLRPNRGLRCPAASSPTSTHTGVADVAGCHSAPWSAARGDSGCSTHPGRARVELPSAPSAPRSQARMVEHPNQTPRALQRTPRCAGVFARTEPQPGGASPAGGARMRCRSPASPSPATQRSTSPARRRHRHRSESPRRRRTSRYGASAAGPESRGGRPPEWARGTPMPTPTYRKASPETATMGDGGQRGSCCRVHGCRGRTAWVGRRREACLHPWSRTVIPNAAWCGPTGQSQSRGVPGREPRGPAVFRRLAMPASREDPRAED